MIGLVKDKPTWLKGDGQWAKGEPAFFSLVIEHRPSRTWAGR
jgi:hypothetical protein